MKYHLVLVLCFICVMLGGCPMGQTFNGLNSFTLHNQHDKNVEELSITKTGSVPGQTTKAINQISEPLEPGQTFTINNLPDGEYTITVRYRFSNDRLNNDNYCCSSLGEKQVFEGGRKYDWFFDPERNSKSTFAGEECWVTRVLDWIR